MEKGVLFFSFQLCDIVKKGMFFLVVLCYVVQISTMTFIATDILR